MRGYIYRVIFLLTCLLASGASKGQILSGDSLYSDFRCLIKYLEETHPDPYVEFGNKIEFNKKAFELGENLKSKEYTISQYQNLISTFLSKLHDGHTFLYPNTLDDKESQYIPLEFKTITDGLIITSIPDAFRKYLGARLLSLNGIPTDSLCERISELVACENKYGRHTALERVPFIKTRAKQLFPDLNNEIEVQVRTTDNKTEKFTLKLTDKNVRETPDIAEVPRWRDLPIKEYLYYKYIGKYQTMYLKLKAVMSQECFSYMKDNNWASVNSLLTNFYKYTLMKNMPDSIDDAIEALPTYAELFRNMLNQMSNDKTENLIIDLRGNGGGWTPIVLPSLYMLYGDNYLNTDMGTRFYRMVSPLFLKKNQTTLNQFNERQSSNYKFGDYIFPISNEINNNQEQKRSNFVEHTVIGNAKDYIKDLKGQPVYTPKNVYVLTDARTFSAAFHYAFYLWKMGATIVGIPSSQAPNTYMEITDFELPYTKIKGSISNSAQYFLSSTDKRAKTFWPDIMPEYKDYKKYNFDQETELLWLLDYIKNKK